MANLISTYNFGRRQNTLKGLTPYEFICKQWTIEPERFTLNPLHQMAGLNIVQVPPSHHELSATKSRQDVPWALMPVTLWLLKLTSFRWVNSCPKNRRTLAFVSRHPSAQHHFTGTRFLSSLPRGPPDLKRSGPCRAGNRQL